MMNLKVFGSICILAFVLLPTVSAQSETTTTAPTSGAPTTVAATTTSPTSGTPTTVAPTTTAPTPGTPTTVAPTTTSPTPGTPTTVAPTTTAPTPATPTTVAPTTGAPSLCDPNPCLNGGTCLAQGAGYTCTCASQYTGRNCTTLISAPDQGLTTKTSRIDTEARITSVDYEKVKDLTSVEGKVFKEGFEGKMLGVMKQNNKLVIDVKVTGVRSGSVIVEYYLVLNTTSEAEAAKIANAVTEAIKSGKIGDYKTDTAFKPDAYIIRKVKASDVSPAPDPATTTVSTALLVILGVALFILLVIIIILIVLVVFLMKLKEKREKQ